MFISIYTIDWSEDFIDKVLGELYSIGFPSKVPLKINEPVLYRKEKFIKKAPDEMLAKHSNLHKKDIYFPTTYRIKIESDEINITEREKTVIRGTIEALPEVEKIAIGRNPGDPRFVSVDLNDDAYEKFGV